MHLHCGETLLNDNKRAMTSNGVDVRLRRQPQVTAKPSRLRLNARAASLHRQQTRRQPQQQPHQRTSSWPVTDTSFSNSALKCNEEKDVSSLSECGIRNTDNLQSYNVNEWKRNANSNSSRPLIHHQRHNLKNRFHLVKTLGEGTYGKVKLASDKATGESVAIKYIKKTKIQDENDLVRIRREIQILSSLRHKHIVNIREVFEKKDKIVLVMDYAQGGELYDFLNKKGKLSEWEARRIFRQIVSAIHYCHQNGIVHRDLKLENIILDNEGNVKIADFGLSNYYSHNNTLKTFCGSPLYASPEIVNGKPYHGPEVDVWSLGVILYTLVHGAMPFESNSLVSLKQQISNGDYSQPSKPSDAAGLIRHMLTVTPSRRATIEDVLRHWWINFGHSHLPNDLPYSPDEEPPIMPYTLTAESTASVSNPPVIIHHRNQSSISSDSDVELDFWPNRWCKRKTTLDSTGNSVSSSVAGSPAPIGENCLSADETNDEEDDTAAIASGLLKLPPDVLKILRGCSSKSLATLLNTDKISTGFDMDVSDDANNPGCQTEECKDAIPVDAEKSTSSVFDSERKPKRGILKRKGKFSGGDSGCVMHEEMAVRTEENPIPKSGHLPRRLPSFRDEAHGIFASKHRASQLLDNPSSTLHHESCKSAISQTTWYNNPRPHSQQEQQFEDHNSHQNMHQQHETTPSTHSTTNHCLTQTVNEKITVISSDIENVNITSVSTTNILFTDETYSLCPQSATTQEKRQTDTTILPSADTGTNKTCNKEPVKVVARPKSILKNSKLSHTEGARNRLSVSSLGSNSSAEILDLSYDSGDNDHFVNQSTSSNNNAENNNGNNVSLSRVAGQENPQSVSDNFSNSGANVSNQYLSHPGHKRTLSDEREEILGSKSSLLYRLTRDAQSLL